MPKRLVLLAVLIVAIGGCSVIKTMQFNQKYGSAQKSVDRRVAATAPGDVSFYTDVQPILERRCSVCHSCYDAPCQLKTTCSKASIAGGPKPWYTMRPV